MKHTTSILCIGLLALCMAACEKDPSSTTPADTIPTDTIPDTDTTAVEIRYGLVLSEGSWGANNGSLARLNLDDGTIDNRWFTNANGRGLGDIAQDMIAYGSKVYATVTFSNSLEVIDPATGLSTRVDMGSRNPRHIAAEGGKLYISCYNPCSVVRVDTASLQIEATCQLGNFHPEGIAIAQGKAFVASSITADYSTYDDKVYVVDLATFASPTTATVGTNPGIVKRIDDNRVLVCYAGNYQDLPAGSAIVDATTLAVAQTGKEMAGASVYNGTVYAYESTYVEDPVTHRWSQTVGYFTLDPTTLTTTPLPYLSTITKPYGIDVDPSTGDIYVTESAANANGDVLCYRDGQLRFRAEAGLFPKKVVVM